MAQIVIHGNEVKIVFSQREKRDMFCNRLFGNGYRFGFIDGFGPGSYDAYTRPEGYIASFEPFRRGYQGKKAA